MTALGVFNTMKARGERTLILGREIRLEVARGNREFGFFPQKYTKY